MNKIKGFLLLIVSLMTGFKATSGLNGCVGGWVQLRCKYPEANTTYESIKVASSKHQFKIEEKNVWKSNGTFHLYDNTTSKTVMVVIEQLNRTSHAGNYSIEFNNSRACTVNLQIIHDHRCQEFNQTAYRTAKTTIKCNGTGQHIAGGKLKFFRKSGSAYDVILSKKTKSNGRFALTEINSNINISISNVSSQDAGVYWCGVELSGHYSGRRKIQLKVEHITNFTRFPTIGQNFSYWCRYPVDAPPTKFICKGEDPSICQTLVTTKSTMNNRFSMKDNKSNITITVSEVTANDTGTYWCGAESPDNRSSNIFFHRLVMTVGNSQVVIIVIICVAVLLLLFVLILIIFYKRISRLRNTRTGTTAQHMTEDCVYENMQEHLQKPDSENAMIFATANFPTNRSDSLCYSTVSFRKNSEKADEALISNQSCEYSTVRDSQRLTNFTVNQKYRSTGETLYSTVNKSQRQ